MSHIEHTAYKLFQCLSEHHHHTIPLSTKKKLHTLCPSIDEFDTDAQILAEFCLTCVISAEICDNKSEYYKWLLYDNALLEMFNCPY